MQKSDGHKYEITYEILYVISQKSCLYALATLLASVNLQIDQW